MSNLTAIELIANNSNATTGLFNQRFSTISANFAALNSDLTINFPSGETLSVFSNIDASGRIHAGQQMGIGATPSAVTTATLTIAADSSKSDYIHFEDPTGGKSNYLIGSRVGGTADGLNIYDLSGDTMLMSISKQSIRFYQQVVGPVFDVGGALADTYNAATFGNGAMSTESRIQAAIDQASIDGVSRVYLPATFYPYSASSVSFIHAVQMVREGGDWTVYDVAAYGATGDGSVDDYAPVQKAFIAAAANRSIAFIPEGRFKITSKISMPSNLEVAGGGHAAVLYFAWYFASGATSGGDVYMFNANAPLGSNNTAIRLHDFAVEGDNTTGLPTGSPTPPVCGGILFRRGADIDVARLRVSNVPGISIAYQGISNARFTNNYVLGGGHDGITGGSFGTWPCSDVVVANNVIGPVGDDGIAINQSVDQGEPGDTRPNRLAVVGNTIFGEVQNQPNAAGRGIVLNGCENVAIVGNSIGSTFADGIFVEADEVTGTRSQYLAITGNVISGAGQTGDGTQSPNGIELFGADYIAVSGNVISNSTAAGIGMGNCTYVNITGNSIISNGRDILRFGVDCSGSTNSFVNISGNVIAKNAGAGIFINQASEFEIAGNTIIDNGSVGTGALNEGAGIFMQSRTYAVRITNNRITDTRTAANKTQSYGIRGGSVSLSTLFITGNRLSGNSGDGISISGSPFAQWIYANETNEVARSNVVGWWSPSAFTAGTALLPGMSFASEVSLGWYRSAASEMALSYGTLLLTDVLVRARANSGTLPQYRYWSGSGQHFQMSVGRTANEFSFAVPNSNGAFLTGTRIGDSVILANSATTLHLGTGSAIPHLSLGTQLGQKVVFLNQTRLASVRTLAASSLTASAANTNVLADEVVFTVGGASGASLAIHSGGTVYIFDSVASAKAT